MTIEQLQYICMVAKTHSITTAAEQLFVTQQTISKAMNKLETELDVKLLERSHKGVTLTHDGEKFVEQANEIVERFWMLYYSMKPDTYTPELEGEIILHMSNYVLETIGSTLLTNLHRKYPKIRLKISEKLTSDIIEGVLDTSDFGIGLISTIDGDTGIGDISDYEDEIAYSILYEDELQVFVSLKSKLAGKTEVSFKQLDGLYAGYGSTPGTSYIFERRYDVHTKIFTDSGNMNLISQAVLDEIAFGLVTKSIAVRDSYYKNFTMLSLNDHPKVQVCLIYSNNYKFNVLDEVVLEEVRAICSVL
ncbi:MAG: LysR family transcriptional regulator [Peptococcaceae bacterium]|nr:LysR family transcriptional regulator [Peptococcaceae bacterium]